MTVNSIPQNEANRTPAIDPTAQINDLRWLADQGAKFALPFGRTKGKFANGWQNTPHTADEAIKHANAGGNVGILTGKHSGNIIAIDRDVNFPQTCEMLGQFAKTAKIARDNAPDRGKFLYRIVGGDVPPTISWKANPSDKHPACEFLGDNGQRHALCPPSMFEDGRYILVDKEHGIQEITPVELDYIWRVITGGSIYADVRAKEDEEAYQHAKDDYIKQVFEHWPTKKIFEHFQKASNGTEKDGKQTRILGNGGLLIGSNNEQWSIPGEKIGGGPLQAWIYCKSGKVEKPTGKDFWKWINEMGDAGAIERTKAPESVSVQAKAKKAPASGQAKTTTDDQPTWKTYSDAVDKLDYKVEMNDLDDTVEVNGRKFNDGMEAEVLMKMHDLGFKKAEWVKRSITATAHTRRHHPIKEFLNGLKWDNKDRLAEFERYVRDKHPRIVYADGSIMPVFGAWLKRFGVGAVAKVLQDGRLRAQNPMLVFSGNQGVGKSTLARSLNPLGDEYFIESFIDPDANDHHRYLATKFIWEVAELGATARKADREGLKAFLTKVDVTFRTPYAHHPVTKPAVCSFIGTINPEIGFLSDPTGHRRFLPVEIDSINFDYLHKIDCRQLWAQFVALYRAGESAALTPEEKEMADAIRGDHETEDPFAGFVLKYYEVNSQEMGWTEAAHEVVDQLIINGVHNANVTNIGSSLKRLGLTSKRVGKSKITTWFGLRRNDFGDLKRNR